MKTICEKDKCAGCGACRAACPRQCVEMVFNEDGFYFPKIDEEKCVDCGRCVQTCPVLNPPRSNVDASVRQAYVAWNKDANVLRGSVSGGLFVALAEMVLERDGVVFGVVYDESMLPVTIAVEKKDDLVRIQGSKYVQASTGDSFRATRDALQAKRVVLFSGLPCQIAGLKNFLQKEADDENLFLCDLLCAHNASPALFQRYLRSLEQRYGSRVVDYTFRNKKITWRNDSYTPRVVFANGRVKYFPSGLGNSYVSGFCGDLLNSNFCDDCPYATPERLGDVTLGDYVTAANANPSGKGVSKVLINTKKGQLLFEASRSRLNCVEKPLDDATQGIAHKKCGPALLAKRRALLEDARRLDYPTLAKKYALGKSFAKTLLPVFLRQWLKKFGAK